MKKQLLLFASFGGPRNLDEIASFLQELLTDPDVISTPFPKLVQDWFFTRVAKRRALKIRHDYERIGGGSPIFRDTEELARRVGERLHLPVSAFHRYLPATHFEFLEQLNQDRSDEILVFPLFPQFSKATTGSITHFFQNRLSGEVVKKMNWVLSYPTHPAYVKAMQLKIREYLEENALEENSVHLLFSAHGLPQKFIDRGDPYEKECIASFRAIGEAFPHAEKRLAYQSKFGRGKWLTPSTDEICRNFPFTPKPLVIVPLSFLSDHIETLFEIEEQYLPLLQKRGISAFRCPALNLHPAWIDAVCQIVRDRL